MTYAESTVPSTELSSFSIELCVLFIRQTFCRSSIACLVDIWQSRGPGASGGWRRTGHCVFDSACKACVCVCVRVYVCVCVCLMRRAQGQKQKGDSALAQ